MPITEILSQRGRGWRRWGFATASVVVHAGLLAALVVSTEEDPAPPEDEPDKVTFVDVRQFAPPPPPPSSSSAPDPAEPRPQPRTQPQTPTPRPRPQPRTPPRATDIVDPVDSLPEPLGQDVPPEPVAPPRATVSPRTGSGQSGEGEAGGVEGGVEGGREGGVVGGQGEELPEPGGTFTAAVVDRKAELRNRRDLPRLMRRLYPDDLQDAGIGGRVVVQFVVGANGRIDMGSVKVMSSTHDQFVGPTREALEEFRFTPATVGGQPVRMLTQLPIVWEVGR